VSTVDRILTADDTYAVSDIIVTQWTTGSSRCRPDAGIGLYHRLLLRLRINTICKVGSKEILAIIYYDGKFHAMMLRTL